MPIKNSHLKLALHIEQTINFLKTKIEDFSDWVATVAFYKALHLVESLLAEEDIHSDSHESRFEYLKDSRRHPRFRHIFNHLVHLWTASRVARYLESPKVEVSSFKEYMTPEEVDGKLLRHRLHQIEKTITAYYASKSGKK